jgi:perosamine synthetase
VPKSAVAEFIRKLFKTEGPIPLHEPRFLGNEKKYVLDCIDSTFVSSVGKYVDRFEEEIAKITGSKYAVATSNGTVALHMALLLAGVQKNEEVLTQPLTFVATANAISYCNAIPTFIDVERENLGICPASLETFLEKNTSINKNGQCINKSSGRIIRACVPVHIFGHPSKIEEIIAICKKFNICVVEDAAEAIGSKFNGQHVGTFGKLGTLSFNGNKTVTSGGGGAIITNDESIYRKGKHLTTTAKVPHPWEYFHDEVGYNYRLPNINAALACAQLEQLDSFIKNKRELASTYAAFFTEVGLDFFIEKKNCFSNYWLNTLFLSGKEERDDYLKYLNEKKIFARPAWCLMNVLPMYLNCHADNLANSMWLADRILNIPSSVRLES